MVQQADFESRSASIGKEQALFLTIALRDNGRQEQPGIWQLKSDGDFSFEAFAFEQLIKSHVAKFGCSVSNCSRHNNLTIIRPAWTASGVGDQWNGKPGYADAVL